MFVSPMSVRNTVFRINFMIIFFTGAVQVSFAQFQEFLLLEKPGTGNRIRYQIGDEILFKQFDNEKFEKGLIVQLTDSSFLINQFHEVPIRTVEAISDRSKVKAVRGFSKASFLVVPAVLLISAADNLFNKENAPVIGKDAVIVATGFAALGALGYLYKGRRYRLENKWRLIAVRH